MGTEKTISTADNINSWIQDFAGFVPWLSVIFAVVVLLVVLVVFLLRVLDIRRLRRRESAILELTPPASADKPLEATRRLFAVLHGLEAGRPFVDKLLGQRVVFSLEVAGSKKDGERFIVRLALDDVPMFEQVIASYLPDVKFKAPRINPGNHEILCGMKKPGQAGHFHWCSR